MIVINTGSGISISSDKAPWNMHEKWIRFTPKPKKKVLYVRGEFRLIKV
jgi:hypothetical protein